MIGDCGNPECGTCHICQGPHKTSQHLPSCDGNPYAHADIIENGGTCQACGLSIQKITAPSRQLDVSICEVCRKPVPGAGRRCCPGIGECFQKLHERDQEKRLFDALNQLKLRYCVHGDEVTFAIIKDAFEAGRRF
jgi:hypothetical protein